jgi:protein-L-isoaspartate(D-aspartate) O-methyltransferase
LPERNGKVQVSVISEEGRGEEFHKKEKEYGIEEETEEEEENEFEELRGLLVKRLEANIEEIVRKAMLRVPRHKFVPKNMQGAAHIDIPLDIGHGQTISAPHMVAIMCELLELSKGHKVLEIGAGSGYNAAVMGELIGKSGHVYAVERIEPLVNFAKKNLKKTGYDNVTVLLGDGSIGCSRYAPYDRIAVTCAAPCIPEPLLEQLKPGGIMVIPVGKYYQELIKIKKDSNSNIHKERKGGVVFVPLIGKYGF